MGNEQIKKQLTGTATQQCELLHQLESTIRFRQLMKQLVFVPHVLLSKPMYQFLNLHRANYNEQCLLVPSMVYCLRWLIALVSDNALIDLWDTFTIYLKCFISQSRSVNILMVYGLCGPQITFFTDKGEWLQNMVLWFLRSRAQH